MRYFDGLEKKNVLDVLSWHCHATNSGSKTKQVLAGMQCIHV